MLFVKGDKRPKNCRFARAFYSRALQVETMLKSCSFTFNLGVFIWATSIIIMSAICGKEVIAKG